MAGDMTSQFRMNVLGSVAAMALLGGCTVESRARMDSAKADSAATAVENRGALGVNADANVTPPSSADSTRAGSGKVVSFSGVSSLRIGMTAADARRALGLPASSAQRAEECSYLDTKGRSRVYVMLVRGTVARLDVHDSTLVTEAGARIGDTESRLLALYRGHVRTEPHKYTDGHYLIVSSPTDSTRRLVFETDGQRVTEFRVGRMPEVMWVEGCS